MNKIFEKLFFCAVFTSILLSLEAHEDPKLTTINLTPYEFKLSHTEIDGIVNEALRAFNVPGASIAIVMNDHVLKSQGYGLRNVAENLPVTEKTLFPIASCTKAFTATLLGMLAEEQKLLLDDPVKKYIPEFFLKDLNTTENLSLRDLLAHRTGLVRHDAVWIFPSVSSRSTILDLLHHLEPQNGLNEKFQYNNLMYSVAGIVIERVTQATWEEAVTSSLLRPLDMNHSNTSIEQLQLTSDFSFPYAEIKGAQTQIPFRNAFLVSPGGGINSNVVDMARWIQLQLMNAEYLKKDILKICTLQESRTMQMPVSSPKIHHEISELGYGLGWFLGKYRGYDWISHGGHIDGFSSDVSILPEMNLGIVILTNSSTDGQLAISCIRNLIIDRILQKSDTDWMQQLVDGRNKIKSLLNKLSDAFEENQQNVFAEALEAYTGRYSHEAYGDVDITIENNTLLLSYCQMTIPLYFKSDLTFIGEIPQLKVYGANPYVDFTFLKDSAGHIHQLQIPFESFRSAPPISFTKVSITP